MTTSQELTAGAKELTVGMSAGPLETADMVLNIGPQHPATHGVLRLRLVVNGERIVTAEPIVGYMHRGAEKLFEVRDYRQIMALANRHDWLSGFANELGVVLGVEAMLGMEVPERATWTRTLLAELTRVMSHLVFLGSYSLELGAITPVFYAFQEREDLQVVRGLASCCDHLVGCGRHLQHPPHDRIECRRALEVVVGNNDLRFTEQVHPGECVLGGLKFNIHGSRTRRNGCGQNAEFLLDAAIEAAVILMAAAGG